MESNHKKTSYGGGCQVKSACILQINLLKSNKLCMEAAYSLARSNITNNGICIAKSRDIAV
jgi:hypothetical protein